MKKNKITKLLACALICSSLVGFSSVKASAKYIIPDTMQERAENMTPDELYATAYKTVMNVRNIAHNDNIVARYSGNGTTMQDNSLDNLIEAVKVDHMQEFINYARYYLNMFPDYMWQARNTFSAILDGYQQPSYEYTVEIADKLLAYTKKDIIDYDMSNISNWGPNKRAEFIDIIIKRQNLINKGRDLNEDIDPAYSTSYSAALDISEQRILDLVTRTVDIAKETKDLRYIGFSEDTVGEFKDAVFGNPTLEKYSNKLETELFNLKKSIAKSKKNMLTKRVKALQKEIKKDKLYTSEYYSNKVQADEALVIQLQDKIKYWEALM